MSQQNHYHLMISFSNHHHMYHFVHISSIKAGREVIEDFFDFDFAIIGEVLIHNWYVRQN